jgi:hypothetical protein
MTFKKTFVEKHESAPDQKQYKILVRRALFEQKVYSFNQKCFKKKQCVFCIEDVCLTQRLCSVHCTYTQK